MRVLVTGSSGFIGQHVASYFEGAGHEVVGMVRCGSVGALRRLQDARFRGKLIWHDLRSPVSSATAKQLGCFDAVLHLAGETHVDRSIENPAEFALSNVVGTTHLLDWARKDNCGRYLQFSTDEVFGPAPQGQEFREEDAHNPRNPYAASKSGAEQMVKAFGNTYKLPTVIVRSMNVFGERQHPEKFIPMVIRKILAGEVIAVHADPTRTFSGSRFYTYAGNIGPALEFVLEQKSAGPYHVVGDEEVLNDRMVEQIGKIMDMPFQYQLVDFHSSRPGHDMRYAMRDTFLSEKGWVAPFTTHDALERTVRWYLSNREWL